MSRHTLHRNADRMTSSSPTPGTGFTRVEVLTVLVFMTALSAFALPAYTSYRLRSHRSEARAALLDMAAYQDRAFNAAGAFTEDPRQLGLAATRTPVTVGHGYYEISSIVATGPSPPDKSHPRGLPPAYTITAAAVGEQRKDSPCLTFTINSLGQQSAAGLDPAENADCWRD
jgi:type IV pilus assembly protein PilE